MLLIHTTFVGQPVVCWLPSDPTYKPLQPTIGRQRVQHSVHTKGTPGGLEIIDPGGAARDFPGESKGLYAASDQ